jgi:hypothetical protein
MIGSQTTQDLGDFLVTKNIRTEFDTTDGSVIYCGWAERGSLTSAAKWRIKRITISGSLISMSWADGNINFDNIWNNRASLTYS